MTPLLLQRARRQSSGLPNLLVATFLLVAAAGCRTAPPASEPFTQYNRGVVELSKSADDALQELQEKSKQRFLNKSATLTPKELLGLGLKPNAQNPFAVKSDVAIVYLKLAELRSGLSTMNNALQGYTAKLVELASPDLVTDKEIDDWATDLNSNLSAAATSLGADDATANQSALISTVASDAFKAYLRAKQREALINALKKNQPQIVAAARQSQKGIWLMALELRNVYSAEYKAVTDPITPTREDPDRAKNLTADQKKAYAQAVLDLNAEYQTRLNVLRELYAAYGDLPAAHAQLVLALRNPKLDLAAGIQLVERGLRLRQMYEDLRVPATTPAPTPPPAPPNP